MLVHLFQFIYVNSCVSMNSFQFPHFNSFISILSCQIIHCNSFVSIHAFQFFDVQSFISIEPCQFVHFISFQFTSFEFTSFEFTMNSYKPCPFFANSAQARAGHYLVRISDDINLLSIDCPFKARRNLKSSRDFNWYRICCNWCCFC